MNGGAQGQPPSLHQERGQFQVTQPAKVHRMLTCVRRGSPCAQLRGWG